MFIIGIIADDFAPIIILYINLYINFVKPN